MCLHILSLRYSMYQPFFVLVRVLQIEPSVVRANTDLFLNCKIVSANGTYNCPVTCASSCTLCNQVSCSVGLELRLHARHQQMLLCDLPADRMFQLLYQQVYSIEPITSCGSISAVISCAKAAIISASTSIP